MQVGVLGPLLVQVQGRDVTPRGRRLRDVFVVLLQRRGRPVPAQTVLELAWGDQADELTVTAVHTVVARLRRAVGQSAITSHDLGYLLDVVHTDEDDFTASLARARRLGGGDPPAAARAYRSALAQWRGPEPFADLRDDLVETDRARLIELRAAATEELAAILLDHPEVGGPAEALELNGELMAGQPLRERPHHLAMLAAYRLHRQADALKIYADLRHRLRTELGIEPTPATTQLQTRILRHHPSLDGVTEIPDVTAHPARAGRIPAPVGPLIGRSAELSTVLAAVAEGRRLLTLVGPGGVGKSRLLVEVGHHLTTALGSRRIAYTELSGLDQPDPGELAVALALQHGVLEPHRAALESLMAAIGNDQWLLLVDEAEWVVESLAPIVRSILSGCPGAQVLVTSRIPLDLDGELLITMEPLECPANGADPESIRLAPAVQFLTRRLTDRAVRVGDDAQTATLLASITRRVDGLPLALELAAGQATGRSLADIAAVIDAPLDVAVAGQPGNPRHRTLRDTLRWSLDRLDPLPRGVLRRLGVFAGRFEPAAARAVAGGIPGAEQADIDAIVRALARDALVHVERTGAAGLHFRLLRTVRDLVLEELDPDELAAAQALHRRWHADAGRVYAEDRVDDVREHLDDYLEALRTALAARDAATLADITLTLARFWQFVGGQAVGLRWIGAVLDSDILGPQDRARVLAQRAALALNHDPTIVLADTAAAIPLLESTGQTAHTVTAVSVRALELLAQGRLSEATAHADRAVGIARGRTPAELANALGDQAVIYAVIEQPDRATAAIDEAIDSLRSGPATLERVSAAAAVALALVNLERFDDAVALLDGVEIPPAAHPPPARFQLTLGWACVGSGDFPRALACFVGAIPTPVSRRPADRHSAETVLGVACTLAALGDGAAITALAGALELLARVDYRSPPALERAIDRARQQVEHLPWPDFSSQPAPLLLERLERQLSELDRVRHVQPDSVSVSTGPSLVGSDVGPLPRSAWSRSASG